MTRTLSVASRRKRQAEIWDRLNSVMAWLIGLAFAGFIGSMFVPEIHRMRELSASLEQKQAAFAKAESENREAKTEVQLLQHDPEYVETIARDKLDLMKEGEFIVRPETAAAAAAASAPTPTTAPAPAGKSR